MLRKENNRKNLSEQEKEDLNEKNHEYKRSHGIFELTASRQKKLGIKLKEQNRKKKAYQDLRNEMK